MCFTLTLKSPLFFWSFLFKFYRHFSLFYVLVLVCALARVYIYAYILFKLYRHFSLLYVRVLVCLWIYVNPSFSLFVCFFGFIFLCFPFSRTNILNFLGIWSLCSSTLFNLGSSFGFAAGIFLEVANWPPFLPLIHHDITNDVPIHLQKLLYIAFATFLGTSIFYVFFWEFIIHYNDSIALCIWNVLNMCHWRLA